ncbi:MAG: adenylate/guanylate cyclase domain-containing protein [Dehalococcoidia bacterium]
MYKGSRALLDIDWDLYVETLAKVMIGVDDPEYVRRWADHYRASIDREAQLAQDAAVNDWDATAVIGDIEAPTLVLNNQNSAGSPLADAQALATGIPDARLTVIDDPVYSVVPSLIEEFVLQSAPAHRQDAREGAVRTVLFTDLVGHTAMMSRLGDDRGRDVLREHERITREVLKANGGTEVKTMGDGFMASFGSVTKAVECAVALQRAFADREGEPLSVRVGINAGEPIEEEGDLFGATVILASRIAAKADGGEILVANTVRELTAGKGFLFADRGDFVAKGFEEPVRLYEVSWRGQ